MFRLFRLVAFISIVAYYSNEPFWYLTGLRAIR